MNRICARQPLRVEQAAEDDLGHRPRAVIRTEQVSSARLKRFRIEIAVLVLHEAVPDSGRNFQLIRAQRLQTQSDHLSLALRVPDLHRLLSVSGQRRRNLRTSYCADRRAEGITMKQINQGEA